MSSNAELLLCLLLEQNYTSNLGDSASKDTDDTILARVRRDHETCASVCHPDSVYSSRGPATYPKRDVID